MGAAYLPPFLQSALEGDEEVQIHVPSTQAILGVTSRRVVVAEPGRLALAVPFAAIRRVQFDIERSRPATLVIVPEHPGDEPQVLSIPPRHYRAAAQALVAIGEALADNAPDVGSAGA